MPAQTPEEVAREVAERTDAAEDELAAVERIARRKLQKEPGYNYIPPSKRLKAPYADTRFAMSQPNLPAERWSRVAALEGIQEDAYKARVKMHQRARRTRGTRTPRLPVCGGIHDY